MFLLIDKILLIRTVGRSEMREHAAHSDCMLRLQEVDELVDLWVLKAQTMHSAVDLDVDWIMGNAKAVGFGNESTKQTETVDFRLKLILDDGAESRKLGIHNDDRHTYALTSQVCTLVGNGNSEIIDILVLQRLGKFITACAIAECLDHAHHLGIVRQM